MKNYQDIEYLVNFYSSYFERLSKKRFEIKVQEFKRLNKLFKRLLYSLYTTV